MGWSCECYGSVGHGCVLTVGRTSPTAYHYYSAYTITSHFTTTNGICTSTVQPFSLTAIYTAELSTVSGRVTIDPNAQQSFIEFLDFQTCSGATDNVSIGAVAHVEKITQYTRTTVQRVPVTQPRTLGPVSGFLLNPASCEGPRLAFGYQAAAGSKVPRTKHPDTLRPAPSLQDC